LIIPQIYAIAPEVRMLVIITTMVPCFADAAVAAALSTYAAVAVMIVVTVFYLGSS